MAKNNSRKTTLFRNEKWYDFEYDKDLIAQSIAKQYGILPTAQEDLHYSEWALLLGGIMEDTPLGQTVIIRRENDRNRLKNFTQYERHIRNEWRNFIAKQKIKSDKKAEDFAEYFKEIFSKMFGKK